MVGEQLAGRGAVPEVPGVLQGVAVPVLRGVRGELDGLAHLGHLGGTAVGHGRVVDEDEVVLVELHELAPGAQLVLGTVLELVAEASLALVSQVILRVAYAGPVGPGPNLAHPGCVPHAQVAQGHVVASGVGDRQLDGHLGGGDPPGRVGHGRLGTGDGHEHSVGPGPVGPGPGLVLRPHSHVVREGVDEGKVIDDQHAVGGVLHLGRGHHVVEASLGAHAHLYEPHSGLQVQEGELHGEGVQVAPDLLAAQGHHGRLEHHRRGGIDADGEHRGPVPQVAALVGATYAEVVSLVRVGGVDRLGALELGEPDGPGPVLLAHLHVVVADAGAGHEVLPDPPDQEGAGVLEPGHVGEGHDG